MQDKERGSRRATLDDALRALSRRAAELETFARRLQADLEAAQEQLADFVDAEGRANSVRARQGARPERRLRADPREPRVEDPWTRSDASAHRGRIVPLRPRNTATPDPAVRRDDAPQHRRALAAEMRLILKALLEDALGPTSSRAAAPTSPRPRTMLRAPVARRPTRRPQVAPTAARPSAPEHARPLIEDRPSHEVGTHPTETQTAADAIAGTTSQTTELIAPAAEPTAPPLPPAMEPPPMAEQPLVPEQPTPETLPAPVEVNPVALESSPNEIAPIDTAEITTTDEVAEMSAAAASSEAPDPRLEVLAEAVTDAASEVTAEHVIDETTPPIDAPDGVVEEPFTAASSDHEPVWASPDAAGDVAPVAPSIDQPTASVDHVSDPWALDVGSETVSWTMEEPAPETYIDTPFPLEADGVSTGPREELIEVSPVEPRPQVDPSPTIPIDAPTVEPRGTVRELQVVLSPIGSFPELLRLQARIESLSSVHTLRLRDFRNGIATFSVGVTEALSGREFGSVLQMFRELRLRLEGAGENSVELRVEPEAAP